MKASELIIKLQQKIKEEGDLPVTAYEENTLYEIHDIQLEEGDHSKFSPFEFLDKSIKKAFVLR